MCGLLAVLITIGAVLWAAAVVAARHRAEAVADLAALGAGERAAAGESTACAQARQLADPLAVTVTGCRIRGWDAYVEVAADLPATLHRFGAVHAHARAGPEPDPAQSHLQVEVAPTAP